MKLLCSQEVFYFSLNFSFMEIINIFVGFHSGLEQNWTLKLYSFLEQSSCVPFCRAKPAWVQEDGTSKSTTTDSTFMSWSYLLSQNVNFNTCMTPKYFMV